MAKQEGQAPGLTCCWPLPTSGSGRLPAMHCDPRRGGPGPASPLTGTVLGGAAVVSWGLAGDPVFLIFGMTAFSGMFFWIMRHVFMF